MRERKFMQHWPVVLLGLLVVGVFVAALVTFVVKETEHAVIMTFGRPRTETVGGAKRVRVYKPGLHLKWPYPIETVWLRDKRLQCYELTKGQVEQIQTSDHYQIIVTTYVLWKIGDPDLFLKRVNTMEEAEDKLDDVVRSSRSIVLGQHRLTELINTDASQVRTREIEQEIRDDVHANALEKYGIEVRHLGLKHLGFPEVVSEAVFKRMRAERNTKSEELRGKGRRDAEKIRALAALAASEKLAQAEADAKRIRAEGDRAAAEFYAVFGRNPELAVFLRKLDSLRLTLSEKTTLVVDTRTPPFDLLLPDATDLKKAARALPPAAVDGGDPE